METVDAEVVEEQSMALVVQEERSVDELVAHGRKIEAAMQQAMRDGEHYGVIPGTKKPTLLKPGAEMLLVLFRLGPDYESEQAWEGEHLTVTTKCVLRHIGTGNWIGSGSALCTTREKRYAQRESQRTCPSCGQAAIIKGKEEFGGGWVCFKKKGGCGSKYRDDDPAITSQEVGVGPNPDLPDTYNTVLKMAEKRALVAAVLNATAASQVFTQDGEDHAAAPAPAAKPLVEDRLASDDEKLLLAGLYAKKKPGGATLDEAMQWVASYKQKGESRLWVAVQVLGLMLKPDPLDIPQMREDLERLGPEPELPPEPIPGQTSIEDAQDAPF